MHGHRDMEIITYVLEGAVEHRDSMGTGSVLRAGEFQHMTAGSGIRHSEFNPSSTEPAPPLPDLALAWERGPDAQLRTENLPRSRRSEVVFRLVASPDAQDGSLLIRQDARVYLSSLATGQEVKYEFHRGRHAWLQVVRGAVEPKRPEACRQRRCRRKRRDGTYDAG